MGIVNLSLPSVHLNEKDSKYVKNEQQESSTDI